MARKISLDLETEILEPSEETQKKPKQSKTKTKQLTETDIENPILEVSEEYAEELDPTKQTKETPPIKPIEKPVPSFQHMENVVTVDGIDVEIKPTKYRYFRNMFTAFYNYLKKIPISDFLILPEGTLDPKRSGDQIVFDFLCAVFDDPCFVQDHYDNMDAELLEKILEIYGRINHIKDREDNNSKNQQAQTTA